MIDAEDYNSRIKKTRNNIQASADWIDISIPLHNEMVHWPDDPPFKIRRVHDIEHGKSANLSQITMGTHSGTHIDAPLHFIKDGNGIDTLPLDATIGPARVIEIKDTESIKLDELQHKHIKRGERILFRTHNSDTAWKTNNFVQEFVFITSEAAEFLVRVGVRVVGVDYLSVGGYKKGGDEIHKILHGGGIWLIEGLDLSGVAPGNYELICLPLKISQGDAAPARAILRPSLT